MNYKGKVIKMESGNWSNAAKTGVFYRNLNNYRSNDNNNAGFRVADYISNPDISEENTGDIGMTFPAQAKSAEGDTESYCHSPTLVDVANIDNLYQGFLNARKTKRNKKAIWDFENNLGENLTTISKALFDNTYVPDEPRTFIIHEKKRREIAAPSFRDSVVQHTIYLLVYERFDRGFIHDSYGCRKGKGTHKAADALQAFMRQCEGESYYVQMDIRKYYYSIEHALLRERIERKIADKPLVDLMMAFAGKGDRGLYIGNLLSQLYGLVFLDRMDHWFKRVMKQKRYVRYVDDFVIVGLSQEEAYALFESTKVYLETILHLSLSKWRIAKVKHGCNFVGFRTWKRVRFVRRFSVHNFSKALKQHKTQSIVSLLGNARHSGTYAYFKKQLQEMAA